MELSQRPRLILHVFAGSFLVVAAVAADFVMGKTPDWGQQQTVALTMGGLIVLFGVTIRRGVLARSTTNLCLSMLSIFIFISMAEVFFSLIEFDFGEARAWKATPVYYRQPVVPTGEVYFRRPGPEDWTGQVLNTFMTQRHVSPNPYEQEPIISVHYDSKGFRNPDGLADWEIAVAGDSFTELGYLEDKRLFTTILGEMLGVKVKNLGTAYTGPLTQVSYLKDYGRSANLRDVVIVFFEGNDIADLSREYESLLRWRDSGQRDYREFGRQSSLLNYLNSSVERIAVREPDRNYVTAYYPSRPSGIPITFSYTPPGRSGLSAGVIRQLDVFFRSYADFGAESKLRLWLAYMPSKRRVLHGHVEFADDAPSHVKAWEPSDLPELIAELCSRFGIGFIDLTTALAHETKSSGNLQFNSMLDTHLNASGSLIVAVELAKAIGR